MPIITLIPKTKNPQPSNKNLILKKYMYICCVLLCGCLKKSTAFILNWENIGTIIFPSCFFNYVFPQGLVCYFLSHFFDIVITSCERVPSIFPCIFRNNIIFFTHSALNFISYSGFSTNTNTASVAGEAGVPAAGLLPGPSRPAHCLTSSPLAPGQ